MQVVTLQYSQPALENPREAKERWKPCKSKGCCSHCSSCCLANRESLWAAERSHLCPHPRAQQHCHCGSSSPQTTLMIAVQWYHSARQDTSCHHESMLLAECIPASTSTKRRSLSCGMAAQPLWQYRQDWNYPGLSWTKLGLYGHLRVGLSYQR